VKVDNDIHVTFAALFHHPVKTVESVVLQKAFTVEEDFPENRDPHEIESEFLDRVQVAFLDVYLLVIVQHTVSLLLTESFDHKGT
jgi:hypothetical protein